MIASQKGFQIPQRLWQFLIAKANISADKRWNELGKKNTRRLIELLTKDHYTVSGKTTFKEEFVTCGGVALEAIHLNTLESKTSKGIYFAGVNGAARTGFATTASAPTSVNSSDDPALVITIIGVGIACFLN